MSDYRAPIPVHEIPKVCTVYHAPVHLNRLTYQDRGFTEIAHIGEMEVWRCPICGAVYAFPNGSDCYD